MDTGSSFLCQGRIACQTPGAIRSSAIHPWFGAPRSPTSAYSDPAHTAIPAAERVSPAAGSAASGVIAAPSNLYIFIFGAFAAVTPMNAHAPNVRAQVNVSFGPGTAPGTATSACAPRFTLKIPAAVSA